MWNKGNEEAKGRQGWTRGEREVITRPWLLTAGDQFHANVGKERDKYSKMDKDQLMKEARELIAIAVWASSKLAAEEERGAIHCSWAETDYLFESCAKMQAMKSILPKKDDDMFG